MPSPSPFRVTHWDFFDFPLASSLAHIEAIQISGAARHFELLPRGGRVYFRLAGDDTRLWATLDDNAEPNFVRTFRRAIGSGRIGRVFQRRSGTDSRAYFLVGADGRLQVREWCMPLWVELPCSSLETLPLKKTRGIFSERFDFSLRRVAQRAKDIVAAQVFTDQERQFTNRRWSRGSEAEWKQMLRAFAVFFPRPGRVSIVRRSRQKEQLWESDSTSTVFECEQSDHLVPLLQIANAYFRLEGLSWRWSHHFELVSDQDLSPLLQVRSSWDWYLYWSGEKTTYERWHLPELTSAHERLEAQLFLRGWLCGKASAEQIQALLSHVVH